MTKRLIVLFDGSGNSAAEDYDNPTNVFRLCQSLHFGDTSPQIIFYSAGVGTRRNRWSAITGRGFDQILMGSYISLVANYGAGDQIYIFGFSRGAATAQALASMVSTLGLLDSRYLEHFPKVWQQFTAVLENKY
jgi:uncharacterized protein (DUF2235 family)